MPDIAKCSNQSCPLRNSCYRYRVVADPGRQTYGGFAPTTPYQCDYFVPIRVGDKLWPPDPITDDEKKRGT